MATPVGMTDLGGGLLLVVYTLATPLAEERRAEVGGVGIDQIGPLDPFIPISAIILKPISDTDFRMLIPANNPPPAPGSPTVTLDFHTNVWTPVV